MLEESGIYTTSRHRAKLAFICSHMSSDQWTAGQYSFSFSSYLFTTDRLLRDISDPFAARCSTMFTSSSLYLSATFWHFTGNQWAEICYKAESHSFQSSAPLLIWNITTGLHTHTHWFMNELKLNLDDRGFKSWSYTRRLSGEKCLKAFPFSIVLFVVKWWPNKLFKLPWTAHDEPGGWNRSAK